MSCLLQDGKRTLHLAIEKGHMDIVTILLKHGANANTKDRVTTL